MGEQKEIHEKRVKQVLHLYDYDGDGVISPAEIALIRKKAPIVRSFRNFDADGQGAISYDVLEGLFRSIQPSFSKSSFMSLLDAAPNSIRSNNGDIMYESLISWLFWCAMPSTLAENAFEANDDQFDLKCANLTSFQEASGKVSVTRFNDEASERLIFHLMDDVAYANGAYDHDKFMAEFAKVNWDNIGAAKWKPEASHFDYEAAISKKPEWFEMFAKETLDAVVNACRKVNRWNFMKAVYASGEDWMTSSVTWTVFTLAVMYDHVDFSNPELRVLDAGCGTGYMLAVWAIMMPPEAEVWGVEIDDEMVILARQEIFQSTDSFAYSYGSKERTDLLHQIEVMKGEVVRMVAGGLSAQGVSDMKPFPADYFDLITCGVALPVPERAIECLKEGGILIIPEEISSETETEGIRVSSKFRLYKKVGGKKVPIEAIEVPDDGKVNFVKANDFGEEYKQ